jgi:phosphohistidine phosphatase
VAPRRLVLVRHGQAGNAPLDRDRPLTGHGEEQAAAIGAWLADHSLVPDRVLVSPARRAVQTWGATAAGRPAATAEPIVDARIYDNTLDAVLAAIQETPHEVRVLAVVGHNPSIGALAHELDDGRGPAAPRASLEGGFPAGGVAVFELPGAIAAVAPATATLRAVHLPGR